MDKKTIWQSKTFLVNLVALVLFIYAWVKPDVQLPADAVGTIVAAINIILRMITGKPIEFRKSK